MARASETTKSLRSIGYPMNLLEELNMLPDAGQMEEAGKGLEAILGTLPEVERELLHLRYREFLTMNEIAERLGIPQHSIRARKGRILRKLHHPRYWRIMKEYIEHET